MRISSRRVWCFSLLLSIATLRHPCCSAVDSKSHLVQAGLPEQVPCSVPHPDSQQHQQQLLQEDVEGERAKGPARETYCPPVGMEETTVGTVSTGKVHESLAGMGHATGSFGTRTASETLGEDYVPQRYIVGCNGDRVEAARR